MRIKVCSVALLGLLFAACGGKVENKYVNDGAVYKDAFAELIRKSDRIVATEHSDELDLWNAEAEKSEITEQIVYNTHELTAQQRAFFLSTIESLDPKTQDAFAACVPSVHHSFHFYSGVALVDTVDICFECSDVQWSGTTAIPPWSIYSGLERVVENIGFKAERDWSTMAEQHLARLRPNKSLERTRER